jgi:hypothetical protein
MKKWELKEKSDAKMVGGKRVPGSGNKWNNPGDVKSDKYLIECKQTSNKSYSLTKEKLDKAYEEALFAYKIPLFSVKIQDIDVMIMFREDWEKLNGGAV